MPRRHHLYAKLPPSKDLSGHRGSLGISSLNPPSIIGVFVDFNSLFEIRCVIMSSTPIGISTLKPERPSIMQDLINWHQVQGWIKHCTASHDCGRFAVSELPRGFDSLILTTDNLYPNLSEIAKRVNLSNSLRLATSGDKALSLTIMRY